jgi:hypothetical protein
MTSGATKRGEPTKEAALFKVFGLYYLDSPKSIILSSSLFSVVNIKFSDLISLCTISLECRY